MPTFPLMGTETETTMADRKNNPTWDEKRMELTQHLGELRTRILRSFWLLIIGAFVAYQFFTPLYDTLFRPFKAEMDRQRQAQVKIWQKQAPELPQIINDPPTKEEFNRFRNAVQWRFDNPAPPPAMQPVFHDFFEPFMVRLKISIIFGLLLVLPLVLWQLAGFITPALTPQERKPFRLLIPVSTFLMLAGIVIAYITMFFAMHWFLTYLSDFPQPTSLMQDPNSYVLFYIKMMAVFGVSFQLPVVFMGMAYLGLITSKGLLKNWRWGVVISAIGGVFTPASDIISMLLLSVPLLLLYFLSILLVRHVERIRARDKAKPA